MSTLIHLDNVSKAYGSQVIFEQAGLTIGINQKVGVIGRNGAGKSTLFKIIIGVEEADSGVVNIHGRTRLGYLEQHDPYEAQETVTGFLTRYTGKEEWQCGKVAARFQLKNDLLKAPIGSLAGGYQMRVKLTAMLLDEPNLLLLDEPTNYLDLSTQLLLEQFLKSYRGSYLVISHDREFLKNVTDQTLEVERGKLFLFPQPLEEYFAFKEEQLEQKEKTNLTIERQQKHLQLFVDRFRAKASKAAQAKSKLKQIQRLKKIEIGHSLHTVNINIPRIERKKGLALRVKDLYMGYGESKIIAGKVSLDIERGEHIAILGDNGQGKTTFLKTLAAELPALAGDFRWTGDIKFAYYAQHVPQQLDPRDQVQSFLERSAAYGVSNEEVLKMAANFLFKGNDLRKKIAVLSGGEKARLCLAGLLLKKTQVMLLDEPSNHLDFETVEALGAALKDCNNTVLFISHNRTFVNLLATGIVEIKNGRVERYHHNYQDYVYYLEKQVIEEKEKPLNFTLPPKQETENQTDQKNINTSKDALKNLKKKIRSLEKAMEENEREKKEIFRFFGENPTSYSQEKSQRLAELKRLLEKQEKEWLQVQEKLETIQPE